MPSRIDIAAPATITVLSGSAILSLQSLPPGGITLADPANGTLSLTITAANPAASLSASGSAGATISASANTLALTGNSTQINTALASLAITEPAGATTDILTLNAIDPGALPASTAIAVTIAPSTGPAFAAPPASLSIAADSLSPIPGLIIGDPQATALAQIGQGAQETLSLTLSAASGILLLPSLSAISGIQASGIGTNDLTLNFTADQLAAVNALLSGLTFTGPAATSGIAYALRNVSGPLPAEITSGNITLNITGPPAAGTLTSGSQTIFLAPVTLAPGSTTAITGTVAGLGSISGGGALTIAPNAALNLPYSPLSLGGTSFDFGTITATTFTESGNILIADSASFSGPMWLGPSAALDFTGSLTADGAAQVVNQLAVSLSPAAILSGNGTLEAGNFSESGRITGPGTLIAAPGGTLLIAAGSIGGGTQIEAPTGSVVILGPDSPLYGVFNATPLTIDNSVTLAFTNQPGNSAITGPYADSQDQSGGVFVITGPQAFGGTITGFAPGGRLIFPGLSNINLFNVSATGFSLAGQDSQGTTQSYIIHANAPAGTQFYAGTDSAGDAEISLRGTGPDVLINGISSNLADLYATAGIPQLIAPEILLTTPSTLSLTVTLAVSAGTLSDGTSGPAANLIITAASPTALNQTLSQLLYTGTGVEDHLLITSNVFPLTGLDALIAIFPATAGTIAGFGSVAPTSGQTALFATPGTQPITQPASLGALIVSAPNIFADSLLLNGISGTALVVDNAATGIFDSAAAVTTNADVTIGDATGPGTLDILTQNFLIGSTSTANLTIAAGAANISGTLGINGSLLLGTAALNLSGGLGDAATTISPAGTLTASNSATAAFGKLLDQGSLGFTNAATASASTAEISGSLALGGTSLLTIQNQLTLDASASLQIGPDASLATSTLTAAGVIIDSGLLSLNTIIETGTITLTGGTITARQITLASTATVAGNGIITPASLSNSGTILATGGLLTLGGTITNTGTIEIAAAAALDLTHGLTGGVIDFTGSNAELTINDLNQVATTIGNMSGHDVIDLTGIAPTQVTFANNSITAYDTLHNPLGGFALSLQSGQPALQILSDNHGGSFITLGGEMPCFARGTCLLTPHGYRPVESFKPGDPVITAQGLRRPIRWIGRRTLDLAGARIAQPILIAAHAFGPGLPSRPLRLSPLHAVFVEGVLIPATHLVNAATIIREPAQAAITYFHIELDRHDIVLADGLPCETYMDTGNRGALYHESGIRTPARKACAQLITTGPKLAAIRRRLHDIALAAGFSLTYQPSLRALSNDHTIMPSITQKRGRRVAHFDLPPATRQLILLSRTASPADTDPESEDRRDLAICLASTKAAGKQIRLGQGWYERAASDAGIWMGKAAALHLPPAAESLTLTMAAIVQSWRPPVDTSHRPP